MFLMHQEKDKVGQRAPTPHDMSQDKLRIKNQQVYVGEVIVGTCKNLLTITSNKYSK